MFLQFSARQILWLRDEAETVSIQQDASKGWLVLRFVGANKKLEHRGGFIGAMHLAQELDHVHALALRAATESILKELACPDSVMPMIKTEREQFTKWLPRLLPRVESMVADGASDEQLALNLLFGGDKFTNLKVISRDLAHSMRRVASRTSFADPFLKRVQLCCSSWCRSC